MTSRRESGKNVAYMADQILNTVRSFSIGKSKKIVELCRMVPTLPAPDAYEQERLEALEGAIESLNSTDRERVMAAMYLLEQLAKGDSQFVSAPGHPA